MLSDEDKKWMLENFTTLNDRIERMETAILGEIRGRQSRDRALEIRVNALEERLHNLEQKWMTGEMKRT